MNIVSRLRLHNTPVPAADRVILRNPQGMVIEKLIVPLATIVGTIVAKVDTMPSRSKPVAFQMAANTYFELVGGNTIRVKATLVGDTTLDLTVTDSLGNDILRSVTVIISGAQTAVAPNFTVDPIISGNNQVGSTLSCSSGTFTGTPTPVITREWRNNGVAVSPANTTNSYTPVLADLGDTITCHCVITNTAGTDTATPSAGVTTAAPSGPGTPRPHGLDYTVTTYGDAYDYTTDVPADHVKWSTGNGGGAFANTAAGMTAALNAARAANKPLYLDVVQTYSGEHKSNKLPIGLYGRPGVIVNYVHPTGAAINTGTPCMAYLHDRPCTIKGIEFRNFGTVFGMATRSRSIERGLSTTPWGEIGSRRSAYGTRRCIELGTAMDQSNPTAGVGVPLDYTVYPQSRATVGPAIWISDCIFTNCENVYFGWSNMIGHGRVDFHRNILEGTYGGVAPETSWWTELHAVNNVWRNCKGARAIPAFPKASRFHTLFMTSTNSVLDVDVSDQVVQILNNEAYDIDDAINSDGTNAAVFSDIRQCTPSSISGTDPFTMTMSAEVSYNRIIRVLGIAGQEDSNAFYGKTRGMLLEGNYVEECGSYWISNTAVSGIVPDGPEAGGAEFKETGNMPARPVGTALIFRGNQWVDMPPKQGNVVNSVLGTNDARIPVIVIGDEFIRCHIISTLGNRPSILRHFGNADYYSVMCCRFYDCDVPDPASLIGLHGNGQTGSLCEFSNNKAFSGPNETYSATRQMTKATNSITGAKVGLNLLYSGTSEASPGTSYAWTTNFGSATGVVAKTYTRPTVDNPPPVGGLWAPTDMLTALKVWIDPTDAATITGSPVSEIRSPDTSEGFDVSPRFNQTVTSGARPAITSEMLVFDGTNDYMDFSSGHDTRAIIQLPDPAYAETGKGPTCTGLCRKSDGTWWVAHYGKKHENTAASETFNTSLIHYNSTFTTILQEIRFTQDMGLTGANGIQGVAIDESTGRLHFADLLRLRCIHPSAPSTLIYDVAKTGAGGVAYNSNTGEVLVWTSSSTVTVCSKATGGTLSTFTVRDGNDRDHLFFDPTYGTNGALYTSCRGNNTPGRVVKYDYASKTPVKAWALTSVLGLEGISVVGDTLYACSDEYYHNVGLLDNYIATVDLESDSADYGSTLTIAWVGKIAATPAALATAINGGDPTNLKGVSVNYSTTANQLRVLFRGSSTLATDNFTLPSSTTEAIHVLTFDTAAHTLTYYGNGGTTIIVSSNALITGSIPSLVWTLGATYGTTALASAFGAVSIGGLIITTETDDREKIEGWLAWQTGNEGLLHASHPYKDEAP
jgi:hypothetical protein